MNKLKIYKTKPFERFCCRNGIEDTVLIDAVSRAERGLVDADLGGGVIKQRLPRKGQGKSGGYRIILIIKREDKCFIVHGYPKSEKSNLGTKEEKAFKEMASHLLGLSSHHIRKLVQNRDIIEVNENV